MCGAKLHVVYDPDADRPIYAAITPARVNDITAAQTMPIEPGATYVFDLGYTTTLGGLSSIARNAASSPGSKPTPRCT